MLALFSLEIRWTCVKVSTVESGVTVQLVTVLVKQVMRTLKIFARTCANVSTVEEVVTVYMVSVTVKQDMSMLKTFVRRYVHLVPVTYRL